MSRFGSLTSGSLFVVSIAATMLYARTILRVSRPAVRSLRSRVDSAPTVGSKSLGTTPFTTSVAEPINVPPTHSTVDNACDTCACEEKPNDMLGSVKPYDRHVIICVPPNSDQEWANDIDQHANAFPYNLARSIEQIMKANKPPKAIQGAAVTTDVTLNASIAAKKVLKVRVTAMIQAPEDPQSTTHAQILVYPDNLVFTLAPEQVASFAQFIMTPQPLQDIVSLGDYQYATPPWEKLVLVCVHGARDKRCGRAGPQVINELQRLLAEEDTTSTTVNTTTSATTTTSMANTTVRIPAQAVAVRGSSHIGGHVYAGTMIVYPEGTWYGRITKHNSAELLNNILHSQVYKKCLRGECSSEVLKW